VIDLTFGVDLEKKRDRAAQELHAFRAVVEAALKIRQRALKSLVHLFFVQPANLRGRGELCCGIAVLFYCLRGSLRRSLTAATTCADSDRQRQTRDTGQR